MKKFYAVLIAFAALFLADISFARLVIEPGILPVTVTSGTFYNAVETSSGAWFCNKGELIISTRTGNTIFLNNITDFDGGAIYAFDGSTTTIGSGVEFSSNTARFGGAVWNGGKMTIENKVVFSSNTADAGGAIGNFGELTVGNEVEFSSNTAKFGGAIGAMPGSTIMIGKGVTFSSNTAEAGGAIYTHQEGSVTETVTIMISSNAAFTSNKSGAGGAIYANPDSEITIGSDSLFSLNTSTHNSGAIWNEGGMIIEDGAVFSSNTAALAAGAIGNAGVLTIKDGVEFSSNTADAGGAIINVLVLTIGSDSKFSFNKALDPNIEDGFAGAIGNAGVLTIGDRAEFSSNTATGDGGGILSFAGITTIGSDSKFSFNEARAGGAIYNNTGEVTISSRTSFTSNNAGKGGAIYAASGSTTTIGLDSLFSLNISTSYGGAIWNEGKMTIKDGAFFSSNTAVGGGAIGNGGEMTIGDGVEFSSNTAVAGGAIWAVFNSTITIGTGAVFSFNTAHEAGGAIYVHDEDSSVRIAISSNAVFTSNTALGGGAICVTSGSLTIGDGVEFSSNTALGGGAIVSFGELRIGSDSKISFNTAEIGGAIGNIGIMTIGDGVEFSSNTAAKFGGAIINVAELTIGSDSKFSFNKTLLNGAEGGAIGNAGIMTIGDRAEFSSNTVTGDGGAVFNDGKMTIKDGALFSSNTATVFGGAICTVASTMTIGTDSKFSFNNAWNGGAICLGEEEAIMTIGKGAEFSSNTATDSGGAIGNAGILTIEDGALFSFNIASSSGGAIWNAGTLNLTANTKNVEFNRNTANGKSNAIYDDEGTINLWTKGANIIFNDGIISSNTLSTLNINKDNDTTVSGKVILNEDMSGYLGQVNLYSGLVELGEKGTWFGGNVYNIDNAEMNLTNKKIDDINFSTVTINTELRLSVEADLQNEKMDNIKADSFAGTGKIKVQTINIFKDGNKKVTNLTFANDTLKAGVENGVNKGCSPTYKYNINYNELSGVMSFKRSGVNPMSQESGIMNFGIYSAQNEIMKQVFTNMAGGAFEKRASLRNNLYVSADMERVFSDNAFERGVWISPYIVKDTIDFGEYVKDVENSISGILAGVDLVIAADKAVSVYCGYNTGEQKYENITMGQNGYILGASGIILKGKLYMGAAANVIINNNEAKSALGTSETENFGYSIGLKGGYDILFGKNWTFEPNLILMYSGVSASEYTNAGGYKVEDEGINGLLIQPGVKVKLDLEDGWQPYGLMDISINTGESATKVAGSKAEALKLDPYFECGLGVNKDFANTPWSAYAQVTGKAGSRAGAGINLGVKYAF